MYIMWTSGSSHAVSFIYLQRLQDLEEFFFVKNVEKGQFLHEEHFVIF